MADNSNQLTVCPLHYTLKIMQVRFAVVVATLQQMSIFQQSPVDRQLLQPEPLN